jgi:hypothetical protein
MNPVISSNMYAKLDAIVDKHEGRLDSLVAMLFDVQSEFGCVPEEAIRRIARRLNLPTIQVFSVVSFYGEFRIRTKQDREVPQHMGSEKGALTSRSECCLQQNDQKSREQHAGSQRTGTPELLRSAANR